MSTIKTIITTIAKATRESARRRALEALGLPVRVCSMCGRECFERYQQDDGQWLCIACIDGLRDDARAERDKATADHARARGIWADECAVLTQERGNAKSKKADAMIERDKARADLTAITAERDEALEKVASLECRRESGWKAAEEARAQRDAAIAERDNLRQHVAITTRGDGLDDLRVRLANAAIAYIEEPEDAKAHEASRRRDHLCAELDAALRAKSEVTT